MKGFFLMRPLFMTLCLVSLVFGAVACSGGDSDGASAAALVVPTKQPVAGKMGNITSPATPAPATAAIRHHCSILRVNEHILQHTYLRGF